MGVENYSLVLRVVTATAAAVPAAAAINHRFCGDFKLLHSMFTSVLLEAAASRP
jgi:hypothetical protein